MRAAFVLGVTVLLSVRFFLFISEFAVDVPYFDQWDFLGPLFAGDSDLIGLFALQHGPHRQGLGLIADSVLYAVTGWNVRAESFAIGACIAAAALVALALKRRLFGKLEYADVLIPLIFLTLAQWETLIGTPNLAHSALPLLLIMLYVLVLTMANERVRSALLLAVNFLLIFTGFGGFMGVITIGVFALARRPVGVAVACASLGAFFVNYTFAPASSCFESVSRLDLYGWFVALMFGAFSGIRSPVWIVGVLGILFLAGTAYALLRPGQESGRLVIGSLLVFSLMFSASTALGRACMGLPEAALVPRYATLLVPAFLGLYFYALTIPARARVAVQIALALALIPGHAHIAGGAHRLKSGKRAWVACYRMTEDIGMCDALTGFPVYPDPARTRLQEKLDYLKENRLSLFADSR